MNKPSFMSETVELAPVSPDRLAVVQQKARELRDLSLTLIDVQAQETRIKDRINTIKQKELPDLMNGINIDILGLEPEGNLPGYDIKIKPYYYANIRNEDETAPAAYDYLNKSGNGDLIKTVFTIAFGRGQEKQAARFYKQLERRKVKVDFSINRSVPWNTLTAWLKEQVEKYKTLPPLSLINGKIGEVADIKPRRT